MGLEIWMAYIVAAEIILVIPGPTIILVISQAITHGRRSVVPLVAGVTCGDATAMIFSLLGLGTIMAASAMLFTLTKWAGAVYLSTWDSKPGGHERKTGPGTVRAWTEAPGANCLRAPTSLPR